MKNWSYFYEGELRGYTVYCPEAAFGDRTIALNVRFENQARLIAATPKLIDACKDVVKWHRERDSGDGELFGLDFVTTCIAAIRHAEIGY